MLITLGHDWDLPNNGVERSLSTIEIALQEVSHHAVEEEGEALAGRVTAARTAFPAPYR